MSSNDPDEKTAPKPPSRLHLNRTLHELESALNEWDSLSSSPQIASPAQDANPAKRADESEFKKRTKLLLDELRRQLAEL
ncbi:MAG: hypothetical protein NDI61_11070 [Bdellovibrionaceae bacterium]|nr:hypothetical protein [Pseudobdellovibrionaceae bacterium]